MTKPKKAAVAKAKAPELSHELTAALKASIDGVAVVGENGKFILSSEAHARMHGFTSGSELIGTDYRELFPKEDKKRLENILTELRKAKRWFGETIGQRRDGGRFPQELSLCQIEGTAKGFVMITHDITERKRAQQEHTQLLQLEKTARAEAEAASRSKDEFLAVVSHELRTPMTAVLGWTWLLRSGDVAAEERDKALEVIDRNMKMQAQIIEDLLDVSSIITGKLHLNVKPVELGPLLRSAADSVRAVAERARVKLAVDASELVTVNADPQRLRQVFWNLLSNSVKFNKEGGTVKISLALAAGCAAITVEDTGQGIEPALLPEIFDPFRQGEESLTRQHRGLGLGLAIVRHLVELHGGSVSASSGGPDRGSAFTVLLPLIPQPRFGSDPLPAPDRAAMRSEIDDALPGVSVLIVDDEPDTVAVLVELLKHCGAKVKAAYSSAEAFEKMRDAMPRLLVSDLAMPVEDGFSLITKVRALTGGRNVRSLALSAHAGDEERIAALEAGFDEFLSKPVDLRNLVAVLRSLHERP